VSVSLVDLDKQVVEAEHGHPEAEEPLKRDVKALLLSDSSDHVDREEGLTDNEVEHKRKESAVVDLFVVLRPETLDQSDDEIGLEDLLMRGVGKNCHQ